MTPWKDRQMELAYTRMVRTWREKFVRDKDGKEQPVWIRGSRNVAREYAWLSPEREGLCSPASTSLTSRLLPAVFVHLKGLGEPWIMGSMDVANASLIVDQVEPVQVHH